MKLLSPDKTKYLICYGGLKVDGRTLLVQTGIGDWDSIATYPDKESAITALLKVKDAMESGISTFEL